MIEELSGKVKELAEFMSDLSEEAYSAGWMENLEYALWGAVVGGPTKYGRLYVDNSKIAILNKLSNETGGWIYFDDDTEETFISILDWEKKYSSFQPTTANKKTNTP